MASSLTLKNLLASRPLYHSFRQPTRCFISSNPFRDNEPQEVEDRPSNLASRVVVPSSVPTTNLISQLALFPYGGGPTLARQWSKTKATKPINQVMLTSGRGVCTRTRGLDEDEDEDEDENEDDDDVLMVNVGIKQKSRPKSAPRSVWINESAKATDMLNGNGISVGEGGVLVSLSHEIGCQPKGVWGIYRHGELHVFVEMPGLGAEDELEVSVEENTVDIEADPPLETIDVIEIDVNERCTLRIDLPEKIFDTVGLKAKFQWQYEMLKISVREV